MFEIYTDGATSNNGYSNSVGGYAWVTLKDGNFIEKGIHKIEPATNNICELLAVINACERVETDLSELDDVVVYSDSAYIINCYTQSWWKSWINNDWKNSKKQEVKNQLLWERLIPFFEDSRFTFKKVKGHSKNTDQHTYWNNYVDKLAVEAKGG